LSGGFWGQRSGLDWGLLDIGVGKGSALGSRAF